MVSRRRSKFLCGNVENICLFLEARAVQVLRRSPSLLSSLPSSMWHYHHRPRLAFHGLSGYDGTARLSLLGFPFAPRTTITVHLPRAPPRTGADCISLACDNQGGSRLCSGPRLLTFVWMVRTLFQQSCAYADDTTQRTLHSFVLAPHCPF